MGFVGSGTASFDGHNGDEAGLEVGWMIMGVCDKSHWGGLPNNNQVVAQTAVYVSQGGLITDRIGVVMILPQVHLRKPCYDLFFL